MFFKKVHSEIVIYLLLQFVCFDGGVEGSQERSRTTEILGMYVLLTFCKGFILH